MDLMIDQFCQSYPIAGASVLMSSLKVTSIVARSCPHVGATRGTSRAKTMTSINHRFLNCLTSLGSSGSAIPDLRIEQRIDEIGEQVAEQDGHRGDEDHPHDHRDVDDLDRLPGQLADAGPAEDGFHDD